MLSWLRRERCGSGKLLYVKSPGFEVPFRGSGILERSEPLAVMSTALADLRATAHGQFVLIVGEAGVGKTALLHRFIEDLDEPTRVLWAECDPALTPRPLGPLLDFSHATGGELAERLGARPRPYEVADALMSELGGGQPTVIVLEDAHWADEATLDVVRLLARRIGTVPVLLVLTYRGDQLPRAHPLQVLLGEPPGRAPAKRVELEPLSLSAVNALAAPVGVDPDELYQRTGGNPFFVTEVLAAGAARVPRTVRDAVLARAARLSLKARELLDGAAVVPGRAEVWLLEALAPAAAGNLEECLTAGVLSADRSGVAFRHEIARLVIEESLPPDRRAALHRAALAALAQPAAGQVDVARLSYHAEAAGDTAAVLRFAPLAAERAVSAGSHREAMEEYARALRFAHQLTPEQRAPLLVHYAEEGYLSGARDEALTSVEEALAFHRARGDVERQAESLGLLAKVLGVMGRHADAASAAGEAVAMLEQFPRGVSLARAYATLSSARGLTNDAEGTRVALMALELAEEVDDTETLIYVLNNLGVMELRRDIPHGLDNLERSRQLAEATGDVVGVGRAYLHTAWLLVRRRDCLTAEPYLRAGTDHCRQHGLDASLDWLTVLDAECALARGRWVDAERIAAGVLALPTTTHPQSRCGALLVLGRLRARRGEDGGWDLLNEADDITKSARLAHLLTAVAVARAEAAWLVEQPIEVGDDTQLVSGPAAKLEPWFSCELATWRRRTGLPVLEPPQLSEPYRSQLRRQDQAAATWWAEHGCPYDAALALHDSGEPSALRTALNEFRRLGARPAATIVARRLREAGELRVPRGPRATTAANPAGLTGREVEVLALLAEGMVNRDIAARLVVSPRTVDHHVAAILHKLEVGDRAGAVGAAARLGLLPQK